jgi:hypothetical protein
LDGTNTTQIRPDMSENIPSHKRSKRRGPSFVTKTACTACRKGRAKVKSDAPALIHLANSQQCDGQTPCARCTSKDGLVCEYIAPVHVQKDLLRQEINELQRYRQVSEQILESLATEDQFDFIIPKLRRKEGLEDILEQLGRRNTDIGDVSFGSPSQMRHEPPGSDGSDDETQNVAEYVSPSLDGTDTDSFQYGGRWTELPLSDTAIEHLLLLYFCWEYPNFSSLSKRHFVKDFNTGPDKSDTGWEDYNSVQGVYCSPLLVNAILAVGCRFTDQVEGRADPVDNETAGAHCYAEAERLLIIGHKERSVTVVQAISLMSTWNASRGSYGKARFYAGQSIRIAMEMGLHHENSTADMSRDLCEVRNTTFWGAFMLDQ